MTKPENPCGYGDHVLPKSAQYDARGIFLTYTCDACHEYRMNRYRPDVLNDPNYWSDEDIYEE